MPLDLTEPQREQLFEDAMAAVLSGYHLSPDGLTQTPDSTYPKGQCCLVGAVAFAHDSSHRPADDYDELILSAATRLNLSIRDTEYLCDQLNTLSSFRLVLGDPRYDRLMAEVEAHE